MTASTTDSNVAKDHRMGLWGAVSFVCGSVIGSGIFICPSTILKATQSVGLSLIIWMVSAAVSAVGAYCYVELGTSIRRSGSDFAYMHYMGLHPVAFAFAISACFLTHTSTLAIQAITFAEYLREGAGIRTPTLPNGNSTEFSVVEISPHLFNVVLSFALVAALTALNFFSIRKVVSRFQIFASAAKIVSTLLIVSVGFYWLAVVGHTENLQGLFDFESMSHISAGGLASAFFAGLLAFDGWDVLNMGAEEIRNPQKTMPLAIGLGMGMITVLFLSVNVAYSAVLSVTEIQQSDAVAMTFAEKAMGPVKLVVPFLICIVLIGSLNSTLFMGSRALHSVSRAGLLPPFLSCWNTQQGSPRAALVVHVVAALGMALAFDVRQLINLKGFSAWTQRTLTIGLLIYIRMSGMPVDEGRIRTPLVMPFIFVGCTSALVATTIIGQTQTAVIVGAILGSALILYAVFVWKRALPQFSGYRKFSAKLNNFANSLCEKLLNGQISVDTETSTRSRNRIADIPQKEITQLPS